MREIKFRAWSLERKCYVDVWEITFDDEGLPGVLSFEYNGLLYKEPAHNFILEQYTGLKDKNDKEICEGDIMDDGYHICKIRWSEHFTAFEAINENDGYMSNIWFVAKYGEVIGNIHENKNLLEE